MVSNKLVSYKLGRQKRLILVLICLTTPYYNLSVQYSSTATDDIYVFALVKLFSQHILLLLEKKSEPCPTVIAVNVDLESTIQALSLLSKFRSSSELEESKSRYISQYKNNILGSDGNAVSATVTENTKANLPEGHPDLSLGFNLLMVNDCSCETESTILSARSVALQQFLRLMALKHGSAFSSVSGLRNLLKDPSRISSLICTESAQPVLDFTGAAETFRILQQIPPGWDSFSKILLVARSAPHLPANTSLREEVEINELSDVYNAWIDDTDRQELFTKLQKIGLIQINSENNEGDSEFSLTSLTYEAVIERLKI